jgi:hypothetical protein
MRTELKRACPSCGNQFSGAKSFIINNMHGEGIEPPTYWV